MSVRLAVLLLTPAAAVADWDRFRGPNGTGVADSAAPVTWTDANVLWKAKLPGAGYSSPVVSKDKVFATAASKDGAKRFLHCVDAGTGGTLWTATEPGAKAHTHKKNSLASGTPAADGTRIVVPLWAGESIGLVAYDYAGKKLWQTTLGEFKSDHGAGMSPILHGGRVYVNYDQADKAEAVCLDATDGKVVWRKPRKGFRACSSTPFVRTNAGKDEIVVSSTAGLTGYDPATGEIQWNFEWRFSGMALRTVGSPVLAGEYVVAPSGDGGGSRSTVAVRPGSDTPLWEKKKDTPYVPCPIAKGDHLYWLTDAGVATCAKLATGEMVWSERVFAKPVTASPVLVGDAILAIAEDGKAVAFKASPAGYEKVGESAVGEAVLASPAVSGGRLYVRGADTVFCIGSR